MSVKIEPYRSFSPAQCFSCQRFGHSSFHCGYPPRCVKCSASHLAKDCPKLPEQDPKCANCHGSHTANYKQCPTLLQLITTKQTLKLNQKIPNVRIPQNTPIVSNPIVPNPQIPQNKQSYASASSHLNPKAITAQLCQLLINITSEKVSLKEALTPLLSLIPLLLNNLNG